MAIKYAVPLPNGTPAMRTSRGHSLEGKRYTHISLREGGSVMAWHRSLKAAMAQREGCAGNWTSKAGTFVGVQSPLAIIEIQPEHMVGA